MTRSHGLVLAALLAAFPLGASAEPAVVGHVVSTSGGASAQSPGGAPRSLACGDIVRAGDVVTTAENGRVGILAGDALAQVDSSSAVRFGQTPEGTPDVALERGKARLLGSALDEAAPAARFATPQVEAAPAAAGGDTEAYVLREKVNAASMMCEWGKPLRVKRIGRDDALVAQPGECAIAKRGEALYAANAHESRIALAAADACPAGSVIGSTSDLFNPNDVAAPPPVVGALAPPNVIQNRPDQSCEVTGCLTPTVIVKPQPLTVIESPVTPGGIPGIE